MSLLIKLFTLFLFLSCIQLSISYLSESNAILFDNCLYEVANNVEIFYKNSGGVFDIFSTKRINYMISLYMYYKNIVSKFNDLLKQEINIKDALEILKTTVLISPPKELVYTNDYVSITDQFNKDFRAHVDVTTNIGADNLQVYLNKVLPEDQRIDNNNARPLYDAITHLNTLFRDRKKTILKEKARSQVMFLMAARSFNVKITPPIMDKYITEIFQQKTPRDTINAIGVALSSAVYFWAGNIDPKLLEKVKAGISSAKYKEDISKAVAPKKTNIVTDPSLINGG